MTVDLAKTRDIEVRPRGWLVPLAKAVEARDMVVRARQATARAAIVVVDQPLVSRTVDVGRQLPAAGGRVVIYAPRGVVRAVCGYVDWLRDADSLTLLAHHAEAKDAEAYAKTMKAREALDLPRRRVVNAILLALLAVLGMAWWLPRAFGGVLAVVVFVGLVALAPRRNFDEMAWGLAFATGMGWLAWLAGPWLASHIPYPTPWMWLVLLVVAVLVFGWFGRHQDRPLVKKTPTMAPHKIPPLTAPMTMAALCTLGNSKMKEPDEIRLLMDVARHGQGYQVDLELPPGVSTTYVIDKREEFAAALRRELGTVWPSVGPRHPGHLSLYVSDVAMVSARQQEWPLADSGKISLFDPHPLFTDQRGEWVKQTLAYTSWVIGAVPRMGKTRALRNLGLLAGLDVRAKVYAFDLKGTGDLSALAKFAHVYRVGDDPEDIEFMLIHMRQLREEMRHRTRLVRELTLEENPERGKVTDALAAQDPTRYGPIVVLVDEVQVWTQEFSDELPSQTFDGEERRPKNPGKAVREEFIAILRDLVKRGPALGIIVIVATQKPDASSIPSAIADNASARLCLKVNGQISNDQILGTSSYQAGVRATQFAFADKGIAYFRGDGADPLVVRTIVMDDGPADQMGDHIRGLRLMSGLLTGQAEDNIEDAVLVANIAEDTRQVMREHGNTRSAHLEEIVLWLGRLREDYQKLDVPTLGKRLRSEGMVVSPLWRHDRTKQGIDLRKQPEPQW